MKLVFRSSLGVFAGLLGVAGLWMLATEMFRPSLVYFPVNAGEAAAFGDAREASRTAARIGMLRGDLWVAAAVTEAAPLLFMPSAVRATPTHRAQTDEARALTQYAARRAPHDSRIWLVLAGLGGRPNDANAEALKISYYTGPNELALAPVRLSVASGTPLDEELQSLVQSEIQQILLRRPDLKPAIASAHRSAAPPSRELFETTIKEFDPGFLDSILRQPQQ